MLKKKKKSLLVSSGLNFLSSIVDDSWTEFDPYSEVCGRQKKNKIPTSCRSGSVAAKNNHPIHSREDCFKSQPWLTWQSQSDRGTTHHTAHHFVFRRRLMGKWDRHRHRPHVIIWLVLGNKFDASLQPQTEETTDEGGGSVFSLFLSANRITTRWVPESCRLRPRIVWLRFYSLWFALFLNNNKKKTVFFYFNMDTSWFLLAARSCFFWKGV